MQENTVESLEMNGHNICNLLWSESEKREWESKYDKMLNTGKPEWRVFKSSSYCFLLFCTFEITSK